MAKINTSISKKQASDSGMALVLILLLIGLFTGNAVYYTVAIPVLIVNMVYPMVFKYFAILWFGFSRIIGTVVSGILLTGIYAIFVIPVGMIRKLMGKDPLYLREFKKSDASVLKSRNHLFQPEDLSKPF
jgi:hypothetical protein